MTQTSVTTRFSGASFRMKIIRTLLHHVYVSREAEMQPAPDEVTCGATTMNHFVVTTAPAQVSRPTALAGLLAVDVAFSEPCIAPAPVEPILYVA